MTLRMSIKPGARCTVRDSIHSLSAGRWEQGSLIADHPAARWGDVCHLPALWEMPQSWRTIVLAGWWIDHNKQVVRFLSLSCFPVCSRHILLIHPITLSITFITPINQQNDFQNGHWPTPRWGSFATSPRRLLIATRSHAIHWFQQIIATKAKPRRPRQGGAGARRGGTASGATGATGARARYASTVPKTVAAPQPFSAEVFKIIISNLPSDVTDAAVRVSARVLCFGHSVYVVF